MCHFRCLSWDHLQKSLLFFLIKKSQRTNSSRALFSIMNLPPKLPLTNWLQRRKHFRNGVLELAAVLNLYYKPILYMWKWPNGLCDTPIHCSPQEKKSILRLSWLTPCMVKANSFLYRAAIYMASLKLFMWKVTVSWFRGHIKYIHRSIIQP